MKISMQWLADYVSGSAIDAQAAADALTNGGLPVELIAGRTAVARVKIQPGGESLAPFETRRDAWLRRIYENARMSSERARALATQLQQQAAPGTLLLSAATYALVQAEVQGTAWVACLRDASATPVATYMVHGLTQRRAGVPRRRPASRCSSR